MKKENLKSLKRRAEEIATAYSNPNREYNHTNEVFSMDKINPLSETTASVTFLKNTGKRAVAFFFLVKNEWKYFFPTDSHILGMRYFHKIKLGIEYLNSEV